MLKRNSSFEGGKLSAEQAKITVSSTTTNLFLDSYVSLVSVGLSVRKKIVTSVFHLLSIHRSRNETMRLKMNAIGSFLDLGGDYISFSIVIIGSFSINDGNGNDKAIN